MDIKMNAWDLGTEVDESKPRVPGFVKAKYMVLKTVPPKRKTIRDGLVVHAALISYEKDGETIQVTNATEGPEGYAVEFPLGKYLVLGTKYRGPKSWYNFVHPTSGKWMRIPQEKFTLAFAEEYVKSNTENWDQLDDITKDQLIDDYFENMYKFGLACDFNFDTSKDDYPTPVAGMVAYFYRRYTPPKEDEKYGNTIITKWPNKKFEAERDFEAIDGHYEQVDSVIAEAILTALETREKPTEFDPTSSVKDDVPF